MVDNDEKMLNANIDVDIDNDYDKEYLSYLRTQKPLFSLPILSLLSISIHHQSIPKKKNQKQEQNKNVVGKKMFFFLMTSPKAKLK